MAKTNAGFEAEIAAEQEFWLSTSGLVSLLVWWPSFKRKLEDREAIGSVTAAFLATTCDVALVKECSEMSISANCLAKCNRAPRDSDNTCPCIQNLAHALETRRNVARLTPHTQLVACLHDMHDRLCCEASKHHLLGMVHRLASHIDGRGEHWGDCSKAAMERAQLLGNSGKKRRRSDAHYRDLCMQDTEALSSKLVYEKDTGGSGASAKRSTGRTWLSRAMSERLAVGRLAGQGCPRNIALCFDAARIGRPAQEILMNVAELDSGVHTLPPAVLGEGNHFLKA